MTKTVPEQRKRKSRKILRAIAWLFWSLLFLAFLAVNGAGLYVGNLVYQEINVDYVKAHAAQSQSKERRLRRGLAEQGWENVEIASPSGGYPLKGTFIPLAEDTKRTVVFLHGFTQNRLVGMDYLPLYQRAGYNMLLVDLRAHGESGGASVTWGALEKRDLDAWLDWLSARIPSGKIGIHGISMGAATALLHAEMHSGAPRASFYIADSPYAALKPLLRAEVESRLPQLRGSPLTDALLYYGDAVCYARERFTFEESAPLQDAGRIDVPVLYIHGEADTLIPAQMTRDLYARTPKRKELALFPGAAHAMAFYEDRSRYETIVRRFLENKGQIL